MHFALAIKNTILVVLIILIVHFMVKNVLLEKPLLKPVQPVPSVPSVPVPALEPVPSLTVSKTGDIPPSKPSSDEVPTTKQQGGLDKAKEELLKFVSDDDDEDLDKYFTKCTTSTPMSSDNATCKSNVPRDPPFPLSTTCDPAIQKLPSSAPQSTLCGKKTTDTKKKVMILQEYDNENSMNGGDLYGGLKAYDMFDDHYQQYSCA
jgi:hypothetical protein